MSVFVAEELSDLLNTRVTIGRINIGLLNRIIIDDVLLDDQDEQEMLKVTRLSAKFDIMPFFKGKISISSVQLFGFTINLNKETPDSPPNFKFVLDAFASKDTVKKGKFAGFAYQFRFDSSGKDGLSCIVRGKDSRKV